VKVLTFPQTFSSLENAAENVKSPKYKDTYAIEDTGSFVRVVTQGTHRTPTGLQLLLASAIRSDWVCVEWSDVNSNGEITRQHAMITPLTNVGDVVTLMPPISYNVHAEVVNARVHSVTSVASSKYVGPHRTNWSPIFGAGWPKWKAISESPCAVSRHPHLRRRDTPVATLHDGQRTHDLETSATGPFGVIKPSYVKDGPSPSSVRCTRCGTTYADVTRYVASCAPDAILPISFASHSVDGP